MEKKKDNFLTWLLIIFVFLLVTEWESTKQAVKDAWNNNYNPPIEQSIDN
ncbi:MAG: hypothetical protein L3J74_12740 [Bacteroidales bacterium]|nr:hypothetical protein [Bacteroidales bacterium]